MSYNMWLQNQLSTCVMVSISYSGSADIWRIGLLKKELGQYHYHLAYWVGFASLVIRSSKVVANSRPNTTCGYNNASRSRICHLCLARTLFFFPKLHHSLYKPLKVTIKFGACFFCMPFPIAVIAMKLFLPNIHISVGITRSCSRWYLRSSPHTIMIRCFLSSSCHMFFSSAQYKFTG